MRTTKKELVSDELKPFVGKLIKENRQKYNYSLEDLSNAINHKKNRQTLHKYETGLLNIPYDIFFEICEIFQIDTSILNNIEISQEEKDVLENKLNEVNAGIVTLEAGEAAGVLTEEQVNQLVLFL